MLGGPEDVHAPGAEFQDEEHVQPLERDRLDLEEVGGQNRRGLSSQKRPSGRAVVPLRCRRDPVASQNLADGGGGDPVPQAPQLALDPGVAPRRIVPRQPEDQFDELCRDRRAPRRPGLAPLRRDQPMPLL